MIDKILHIILIGLFFIVSISSATAKNSLNDTFTRLNSLEIDSLYRLGEKFSNNHQLDSALICYSICGNKGNITLPIKEKKSCVNAFIKSSRIYFMFYDYDGACQQLINAIKLCDEGKMDECLTGIYMEQGALMMTYANQKSKESEFKQAENAYRKAFWHAYKHKQYQSLITAFFNLGNRFYSSMRLSEIKEELEAFKKAGIPQDHPSYKYIMSYHSALNCIINGDYVKARRYFEEQLEHIPKGGIDNILRIQAYANITKSFILENELDSAIAVEKEMYQIASNHGIKDAKALSASALARLYESRGDSAKASEYSLIAFTIKDSLLSVDNLDEVNSLKFIEQLHKEEARFNRYKNTSQWLIIGLVVILISVVVGVGYWYRNKKSKTDGLHSDNIIVEDKPKVKYENSSLDDNYKQDLKDKITLVLSQTDQILSQDFCLAELAELCESKPKYVSQVINELYGQNFTSLINSLRIKEACKRMSDKENFGSFTLEAIGQSVGFKSRVTFYNAFKKYMGMTPSEYLQRQNTSL